MSRPKSMSDFASLFDASMPPPLHPYDKSREHPRKKPSISLAAGLIMASVETHSPRTNTSTSNGTNTTGQDNNQKNRDTEAWSEGLFYAYAQKDTTPPTPPSVLTFSSAHTASQWWSLVQTAYPTSTRPSPQFFILRTTSTSPSQSSTSMPTLLDPLTQILQNPHFSHLNNKWFFTTPTPDSSTPSPPIIPLQTSKGHPLSAPPIPLSTPPPPPPPPPPAPQPTSTPENPSLHALLSSLETLTTLTTENTSQIHALTTAQSASLTTTQQYYETTSSQLRTLASTQSSLQSLLASTTRTTKTLSSAHAAQQQESRKQSTTIATLAETQNILLQTSQALVQAVDALTTKVQSLSAPTSPPPAAAAAPESPDSLPTTPLRAKSNSFALSDASTLTPSSSPPFMFPQQAQTHRTRISPPPRKLNRRIKGVWYEYDMTTPISTISTPTSVSVASTPSKSVSSNATSTPKMVSSTTPRSVPTFDPGKMAKAKSNALGSGLRTATVSVKGQA